MKKGTALRRIICGDMKGKFPSYVTDALNYSYHPQQRTEAFHRFYGAPVMYGPCDRQFSHMDDERVAFRAAFILSEAFELLRKGLGVELIVGRDLPSGGSECVRPADDHQALCALILKSLPEDRNGRDLVEVVDALGDLNVVVNGFAVELGVDMMEVDQEVCASNFTKADENGQPLIGDGTPEKGPKGKVMKGPNFMEPQLEIVLGLKEPEDAVQK